MKKPVIMWVVIAPNGSYASAAPTELAAKQIVTSGTGRRWPYFREDGYRVAKVEVREIEK